MDLKAVKYLSVLFLVACSNNDNLATIGQEEVSRQQFEAHLEFKRIDPSNAERVQQAQSQYLERKALAQAILEEELIDEAALEAEFDEFRTQMIINRYLSEYLDKTVDDTALTNYYNSHPSEFQVRQAHVAHIVFRTHNAMAETELQAVQQKARNAQAQLMKGAEFEDIAKSSSEDLQSGPRGGELGWITETAIDPAFAQAAFALESGSVSDIVKTQYGYHLIKLLDPVRSQTLPFDQVKGDIRYRLRNKTKAAETQRLRSSLDITVHE